MLRLLFLSLFISTPLMAQNLMEERIWKVSARKKSIFLDSGVFHHNSDLKNSSITGVRSSATPGQGYERVVVDFNTTSIPKIYGHVSGKEQKLSVDFFDSSMATTQPHLNNSKNVANIEFLNVDGKSITMNVLMKGKSSFDIFYLENPGRLVIDIR